MPLIGGCHRKIRIDFFRISGNLASAQFLAFKLAYLEILLKDFGNFAFSSKPLLPFPF